MATETRPMFDTEELVINMGPQHPSTHGVLRVVLRLDGEKVVDSDVVIGYLHRGIEKLSENRNWTQIILLTDRMDYVAAATNNVGYCQTVEKLMQLEVPRRARYVRVGALRAAADREPLPVARHARDGHRRDDGVPLRVPRARADSRSVRGVLRRAAHLQLDAHRRAAARHPGRLGQEGARVLQHHVGEGGRVRGAAHPQPHLARAHQGHRRHHRRRRRLRSASAARRCAAPACRKTSARTSRTPPTTR